MPARILRRALAVAATGTATLGAGEPHEEQQDEGADDRSDNAHGVEAVNAHVVVLDEVLEESADEGPDDAEHDGAEDAEGVTARKKQAGDQTGDQADDDQDDDEGNHGSILSSLRDICVVRKIMMNRDTRAAATRPAVVPAAYGSAG